MGRSFFRTLGLALAIMVWLPQLRAQDSDGIDSITMSQGKLIIVRGNNSSELTEDTKMPFGVLVSTNGTFKVNKGKARPLLEGQMIRSDGNLLNPDGSIMPVFNHLAMKNAKVIEVIDGSVTLLTEPKVMPDGSTLFPTGLQVLSDGRRLQLVDGQLLKPDGSWLPSKETISLKNGQVVVQKDGDLFALKSFQVMGTSDGTKVEGNGTVTLTNGKVIKLAENQTVLVDGPIVKR